MTFPQVSLRLAYGHFFQKLLVSPAVINGNRAHIGGDEKNVHTHFLCKFCTRQIFINNGIHPGKRPSLPDDRYPSPAAADNHESHSDKLHDLIFLHNSYRIRRGDHTTIPLFGLARGVRQMSGRYL